MEALLAGVLYETSYGNAFLFKRSLILINRALVNM